MSSDFINEFLQVQKKTIEDLLADKILLQTKCNIVEKQLGEAKGIIMELNSKKLDNEKIDK
ncbi:MAG TPA: hypothetical protein VIH90_03380 [Candidatus Saccharimonadales bacterium]